MADVDNYLSSAASAAGNKKKSSAVDPFYMLGPSVDHVLWYGDDQIDIYTIHCFVSGRIVIISSCVCSSSILPAASKDSA